MYIISKKYFPTSHW